MKLLKIALLTLTLLAFGSLARVGSHTSVPQASSVMLAAEPASWLLVAFGLVGGGFLHRRRLPGLRLLSAAITPVLPDPNPVVGRLADPVNTRPTPSAARVARFRDTARWRRLLQAATVVPNRSWVPVTAALVLLLGAPFAVADSFTFSSQMVPSFTIGPSSDTFSLNSNTATVDSSAGVFVLQTGDFVVGNSQISDQVIPFSFQDTITLNGMTGTFTMYGQDAITQSADTLTIFGSGPVNFGGDTFALQTFTLTEANMGDFPVTLDVTVTPEPASLLLLGSGIIAGALFLARKNFAPRA